MSAKRLERSERNRVIAGLFGGLGEYLNVDPNILRLVGVVLLIVAPGVMVVLYALGVLLIPKPGGKSYLTPEIDLRAVGPVAVGVLLVLLGSALISPLLGVVGFDFSPILIRTPDSALRVAAGATILVIGLVLLLDRLRRL